MKNGTLLSLNDVGYSPGNGDLLSGISLDIREGSTVSVLGTNGSGKSLLAQVLAGSLVPTSGKRCASEGLTPETVGCLSFELQRTVMEEERRNDDSQFMHGALDPGRTVENFCSGGTGGGKTDPRPDDGLLTLLLDRFNLAAIRSRGLRFLSSGEFRKTLIVRALFRRPRLLILDDPFDGLDLESRNELTEALGRYHGKLSLVLVSSRLDDIPLWTDTTVLLDNGRLAFSGSRAAAAEAYLRLTAWERTGAVEIPVPHEASGGRTGTLKPGFAVIPEIPFSAGHDTAVRRDGNVLIAMRHVTVRYYGVPVLTDVNWTVGEGEHWRIRGPNGSGKSTLLDLVNGDNPKAYGQDISLFGRQKGSGETIWDIKKRIGFVSGGLHLKYPGGQRVLGVVLSGLYDSIGLYCDPTPVETETAAELCRRFGLGDKLAVQFGDLSFGLQRIALIARSMIKAPQLLILDEPCNGLDDAHTELVLSTAELIASTHPVTLLFVTHDPSHVLPSVKRDLTLIPHPEGGFTAG